MKFELFMDTPKTIYYFNVDVMVYFFSWYFSLISISYKEHKISAQLTAKCLAAVLCKACKTTALLSMTFRLCHCI